MQNISVLIHSLIATIVSFYSLTVKDSNGNNIAFSNFTNKKVLIVNTSINSADTMQYQKLELLYQKYKDSLVVIAVPSNDFGNTPQNNAAIKTFIQQHYNIHYLLTEKMGVKTPGISPLYNWLANYNKNGIIKSKVRTDFNKYLVDKNGYIMGVFDAAEDVMGNRVTGLIESFQ